MDSIRHWGISVCFAAAAGGIMHMLSPGAAMERIFRIVLGVFFVCTALAPVASLKDIELGQEWIVNEEAGENLVEEYENTANEIFELSAAELLRRLAENKLESFGINNASVSVYITEKTNRQLSAEDIEVEVFLDKEYFDRHREICRYLEYELGTTIRVGYRE